MRCIVKLRDVGRTARVHDRADVVEVLRAEEPRRDRAELPHGLAPRVRETVDVPARDALFVAVPTQAGVPAEIRVFSTR